MDGVIVRSKAQFMEKGERFTKYFFGLENNNRKRIMLDKLVNEESGESLLTQDKISEHAVFFYQKLYSMADQNRSTTDSYLTECPLNKIPEMLSSALDEPINLDEMDAVVGKLKNNKSPGWDGMTAKFYRLFRLSWYISVHSKMYTLSGFLTTDKVIIVQNGEHLLLFSSQIVYYLC